MTEKEDFSLKSQEHCDLMAQFDREFHDRRLEREPKTLWPMGILYQDGSVNDLFLAYRCGYAFGKVIQRAEAT